MSAMLRFAADLAQRVNPGFKTTVLYTVALNRPAASLSGRWLDTAAISCDE